MFQNKYFEILKYRATQIIQNNEMPIKHSFKDNKLKTHLPLRCYCFYCNHKPLEQGEPVYRIFPNDKKVVALIRKSCLDDHIFELLDPVFSQKPNLFKTTKLH